MSVGRMSDVGWRMVVGRMSDGGWTDGGRMADGGWRSTIHLPMTRNQQTNHPPTYHPSIYLQPANGLLAVYHPLASHWHGHPAKRLKHKPKARQNPRQTPKASHWLFNTHCVLLPASHHTHCLSPTPLQAPSDSTFWTLYPKNRHLRRARIP